MKFRRIKYNATQTDEVFSKENIHKERKSNIKIEQIKRDTGRERKGKRCLTIVKCVERSS